MRIRYLSKKWLGSLFWVLLLASLIPWRSALAADSTAADRDLAAASQYAGRIVDAVRILGNSQVSTSVILQLVRTHEGDKFDPNTAVQDYQRIYDKMKTFANVEARVQPTTTGVIVIFIVTEQKQIREIRFVGNVNLTDKELRDVVDLRKKEAIDLFRINLAQQAIERLYRNKNYPFAHVQWSTSELQQHGDVIFHIVEGPQVTVRKVDFIGNNTFSGWRLAQEIHTAYYIFIFNPGKFDPEVVADDVVALQRFYQDKGFFDVRVGRKLSRSPDMKEMQVTYLIDEGPRYYIDDVSFAGNHAVSEADLRKNMKMLEGKPYDKDGIDTDVRTMVKAYSLVGGYVYQENATEYKAEYLHIEPQHYLENQRGKVRVVYGISEGRQFRLERILIKGNERTQDKVILREMHLRPGQQYNSAEVADAQDRLRGLPEFQSVTISPEGTDPDGRDLLIDVTETRTAQISAGIGINSNGGFGGQLAYEQQDFDITDIPSTWGELFSDRAFTGAGQDFRVSFEPGTEGTNATVSFTEPYLFDQPYSYNGSLYYETRIREVYNDQRVGGSMSFGKRFDYIYSANVFMRAEDVDIKDLDVPYSDDPAEIVAGKGHHTLTSIRGMLDRDTTNHGPVTYEGNDATVGFEEVGAMGGTVYYDRLTSTDNAYQQITEDLLGRKSVLSERISFGWDPVSAPFYERFYGGGFGSIRGFNFRGVSPRDDATDIVIGGDFATTGGVEYDFPLAEDFLRGDFFVDAGDVEPNAHFGVIRSAAGFGFRLILPFFGKAPLAIDFGFPITQSRQDNTQVVSFSFGISR